MLVATGIVPRIPAIPASTIRRSRATSTSSRAASRGIATVAIVGAGGIGFDVAELLTAAGADGHASDGAANDPAIVAFREEWGIDTAYARGGIHAAASTPAAARKVWLLQRKDVEGRRRARQDHRLDPRARSSSAASRWCQREYVRIDDAGLHVRIDGRRSSR